MTFCVGCDKKIDDAGDALVSSCPVCKCPAWEDGKHCYEVMRGAYADRYGDGKHCRCGAHVNLVRT